MRIQVTRYADVTVIEGDEEKLAEMISIHGAANVVNLDAEIVKVDYQEPEEPVLVDQAPSDPVVNSSEPTLPDVVAPEDQAIAEPAAEAPAQV
jgi:hypothetical protein